MFDASSMKIGGHDQSSRPKPPLQQRLSDVEIDGIATREDINSGETVLRPSVHGKVGLGDNEKPTRSLRFETTEIRSQDRSPGSFGGFCEEVLKRGGLIENAVVTLQILKREMSPQSFFTNRRMI